MSHLPTAVYDVQRTRKAGWPTRREPYGHGVPIVVSERESRLQGEVEQVENGGNVWIREMRLTMLSKPEYTGEPDAMKVARPVRRGAVGKVPEGNSLAAYPTQTAGGKIGRCPVLCSCARSFWRVMRSVGQSPLLE